MNSRNILTLVGIFCLAGASATRADLSLTFNTGVDGVQYVTWSPALQAVKQSAPTGNWTMGTPTVPGSEGPRIDFGALGYGPMVDAMAASGLGRLSFDAFVDGSSFVGGTWDASSWFQIHYASNSGGGQGWTQAQVVNGWHNGGDNATYSWHVDVSFAAAGYAAGDGYFQLFWGSNSDTANPVGWYIDNVRLYTVPEPSTFVLSGLGAAAMMIIRRRK